MRISPLLTHLCFFEIADSVPEQHSIAVIIGTYGPERAVAILTNRARVSPLESPNMGACQWQLIRMPDEADITPWDVDEEMTVWQVTRRIRAMDPVVLLNLKEPCLIHCKTGFGADRYAQIKSLDSIEGVVCVSDPLQATLLTRVQAFDWFKLLIDRSVQTHNKQPYLPEVGGGDWVRDVGIKTADHKQVLLNFSALDNRLGWAKRLMSH